MLKKEPAAKKIGLKDNQRRMWAMCERSILYDAVVVYQPLFPTLARTQAECRKKFFELTGESKIDNHHEMRFFRLTLEFQSRSKKKREQADGKKAN